MMKNCIKTIKMIFIILIFNVKPFAFYSFSQDIANSNQNVSDTLVNIKITFWDGTTVPYTIVEYRNGQRNGKYTMFHENGQKFTETSYVDDKCDGKYIGYYKNGKKLIEGRCQLGNQVGHWIVFSAFVGKKKEIFFDNNGKKISEKKFFLGIPLWTKKYRSTIPKVIPTA